MTWNYRIIKCDKASPKSPWFEVREVYYDENGEVSGYTTKEAGIGSETTQGINAVLMMIRAATKKPILLESELHKRIMALRRIERKKMEKFRL